MKKRISVNVSFVKFRNFDMLGSESDSSCLNISKEMMILLLRKTQQIKLKLNSI